MKLENQNNILGLGSIRRFADKTNEIIGEKPVEPVVSESDSLEKPTPTVSKRYRPASDKFSVESVDEASQDDVQSLISETVQEVQKAKESVQAETIESTDSKQSFKDKLMMRLGIGKEAQEILDDEEEVEAVETDPVDPEVEAKREEAIAKIKKYSIRTVVALAILGAFAGGIYKLWDIIKNKLPENNDDLDSSISAMVTPEPTPSEVPEIVESNVMAPEVVAKELYNELLSLETDIIRFNLPNGEDTILNMIAIANPSLKMASNMDMEKFSETINEILENSLVYNKKLDLGKFLYTYDDEVISDLNKLYNKALSLKSEELTLDANDIPGNAVYTDEQIALVEKNGVDPTDDKEFMTLLEELTEKYSTDDVNNVPLYMIFNAIYNQNFSASKTVNYLTHYKEGLERDNAYRQKEAQIFTDEKIEAFEAKATAIEDVVSDEQASEIAQSYYKLITDYEKLYDVKFTSVDSLDKVSKLANYLNGKEEMNPKEALDIFTGIVTICKEKGLNPRFDTLVENTKYASLIQGVYNRISALQIDYEYYDDKEASKYLAENLLDAHTSIINIHSESETPVFMVIMAIYDSYKDELFNYCRVGGNGEFEVNGEPYYSCAAGIRDDLQNRKEDVIKLYEKEQSLNRSR